MQEANDSKHVEVQEKIKAESLLLPVWVFYFFLLVEKESLLEYLQSSEKEVIDHVLPRIIKGFRRCLPNGKV